MSGARTNDLDPGVARSVLGHRWVVAFAILLGLLAGWWSAGLHEPVYDAYALVLLADPSRAGIFEDTSLLWHAQPRSLRNQARHIRSQQVLSAADERLDGRYGPAVLADRVGSEPWEDRDVIAIRGTAADAAEAAAIADAVAESYADMLTARVQTYADAALNAMRDAVAAARRDVRARRARGTEGEYRAALQHLRDLESQTGSLLINAALHGSPVVAVEAAQPPDAPSFPRPRRSAAAGGLLGALAGTALAWGLGRRQTVHGSRQLVDVTGAPVLTHLPPLGTPAKGPWSLADGADLLAGALRSVLGGLEGKTVALTRVGADRAVVKRIAEQLVAAIDRAGVPAGRLDAVSTSHASGQLQRQLAVRRTRSALVAVLPNPLRADRRSGSPALADGVVLVVGEGVRLNRLVKAIEHLDLVGASVVGCVLVDVGALDRATTTTTVVQAAAP